jgi:hypothetical protein
LNKPKNEVDPTFWTIVKQKKINYVEYREQINDFIQKYIESIDILPLQEIVNSKLNVQKIMDMIKRYIMYYYLMTIAYYYTGDVKEFRNNLISYSKLQENSTFQVRNFFNTDNNYNLIKFFKLIHDCKYILLLTELQKKTENFTGMQDAVQFLNQLGTTYVDEHLLQVSDESNNALVTVNEHNLIKTIIYTYLYKNKERGIVLKILNDTEEDETEYMYIDIIVTEDITADIDKLRALFPNNDKLVRQFYQLALTLKQIAPIMTRNTRDNEIFKIGFMTPIVEDFLRYHRDSERLEFNNVENQIIPAMYNSGATDSVRMALLYQERKKKENTRAQLIVNKLDMISDLYSESVRKNPELQKSIQRLFSVPLEYHKAVTYNYYDELHVLNKIIKLGRRGMESNEYYLELRHILNYAFHNFKAFNHYGISININQSGINRALHLLRHASIEYLKGYERFRVDTRSAKDDDTINVVGFCIGPISDASTININRICNLDCVRREKLLDIRDVELKTSTGLNNSGNTFKSVNGYEAFLFFVKELMINTLEIDPESYQRSDIILKHNYKPIIEQNPELKDRLIYWIYDLEKDIFDLESYEDVSAVSIQDRVSTQDRVSNEDRIALMNYQIYKQINFWLIEKLQLLIKDNLDLGALKINKLLWLFTDPENNFTVELDDQRKTEMFLQYYLLNLPKTDKLTTQLTTQQNAIKYLGTPQLQLIQNSEIFTLRIDTRNPIEPSRYIEKKLTHQLTKNESNAIEQVEEFEEALENIQCQHHIDWNELSKFKFININKYNIELSKFIDNYAHETPSNIYICNVCSEELPIIRFIQDGQFNDVTQRFVTNYIPAHIPLENIREYRKYTQTIRFINARLDRMALTTDFRLLIGGTNAAVEIRKTLVKGIIDLLVTHNRSNLKRIDTQENAEQIRQAYYSKTFQLDMNLSVLFFFELSDKIFDTRITRDQVETDINVLKKNVILLYALLFFVTELNSTQIITLASDRYANIYTYLKYAYKTFGDIRIRTSVNSSETVLVTDYPVLCYLVYAVSRFMIKYNLWSYKVDVKDTRGRAKTDYNPTVARIIINSFFDLFNSILIETGNNPNNYVYQLVTLRIYTKMNDTFKNQDIILALEDFHKKYVIYDKSKKEYVIHEHKTQISPIDLNKPFAEIVPILSHVPLLTRRVGNGVNFYIYDQILYPKIIGLNDITNCTEGKREDAPVGDYHKWKSYEQDIRCQKCYHTGVEVSGQINMNEDAYYFALQKTAERRCLTGLCQVCHQERTVKYLDIEQKIDTANQIVDTESTKLGYTDPELDQLENCVNEIIRKRNEQEYENYVRRNDYKQEEETRKREIYDQIIDSYTKVNPNLYGYYDKGIDQLLQTFQEYLGDGDLGIENNPVYLNDNVFIINRDYKGTLFPQPYIINQNSGKMKFQHDNQFFKRDVYYYSDERSGHIDVYYDTVTLRYIGYKESHHDYVAVNDINNYLYVSPSIKERIKLFGYETRYIDISCIFNYNFKIYNDEHEAFNTTLNSLIEEHIVKTKSIIDKMIMILSMIINYSKQELNSQQLEDQDNSAVMLPCPIDGRLYCPTILQTTLSIDTLVAKYAAISKDILPSDADYNIADGWFGDYNESKDLFEFQEVDWKKTTVEINRDRIDSEIINFYDISSNTLIYYLINKVRIITDFVKSRSSKVNTCLMFVEIINYVYKLYNKDAYKNLLPIKRFNHIIHGKPYITIDLLAKGQGLQASRALEDDINELMETEEKLTEEEKEQIEELEEEANALDVEDEEDEADEVEDTGEVGEE